MAVLEDFQFELDGYTFGQGLPVFVDAEGFDPGNADEVVQDGVNPRTGARVFGRDLPGAPTWTFACHVDREDVDGALESAAAMGAKWRDEKWLKQGAVAMLRYRLAGRTRVIFGRPRRFSFKPGNGILGGHVPPLATFDASDAKHYDDVESYVDLTLAPQVPGGFEVPFEAPLLIQRDANVPQAGAITVGGDTSTALVVEFTGPVLNPKVVVGPVTIGVLGQIPVGGKVVVDARPWAMTLTRTGGAASLGLSRETRLTRSLVGPGDYSAVFSGIDLTGNSRCRVRWRNAYTTL